MKRMFVWAKAERVIDVEIRRQVDMGIREIVQRRTRNRISVTVYQAVRREAYWAIEIEEWKNESSLQTF